MKHWLLRGITMNDFLWYSLEVQLKSKSWFNGPTRNYWTCSSDSKESAWNTGDPGSIPGLERSSGEGNGNPLQYSCLENPMNRGPWQSTVYGVTKSNTTEWLTLSCFNKLTHEKRTRRDDDLKGRRTRVRCSCCCFYLVLKQYEWVLVRWEREIKVIGRWIKKDSFFP